MKRFISISIVLLAVLLLASCVVAADPLLASYYLLASEKQFKGIEVYYFEIDGEYRFVMTSGTNRHKFAEDINPLPLATLEDMKHIISTMSEEVKDQVTVHYIPTYPCPEGPVIAMYDDNIGLQTAAIRFLLGLK